MAAGILIPISDHPRLPLKRKVEVYGFQTNWALETIRVFLKIHHYLNNNGQYGDEFVDMAVVNYEDELAALNKQLVDSSDGMELIVYNSYGTDGSILSTSYSRIDNSNPPVGVVIGQFDFFNTIIQTQPVIVGQVLTQYVTMQDVLKKRWNN